MTAITLRFANESGRAISSLTSQKNPRPRARYTQIAKQTEAATRRAILRLQLPHSFEIGVERLLCGISVMLRLDNCNGGDVHDIGHLGAPLQHVHRLR